MEAYVMRALIDVLKIPMREALREDKGGVYGVGVSGGLTRHPKEEFGTSISFGCDPDNVDELIQTTYQVIEKLKTEGPREEDLESIKEMHIRGEEDNLRQNGFWSGVLGYYAMNDLDFGLVNTRADRARALTSEMIRAAAIKYFDDTNRFVAKLFPEEKGSTE
jgi:zinc protease